MDLETLHQKIIDTRPEDWNKVTCWGWEAGRVYHDGFSTSSGSEHGVQTEVNGHANIAFLLEDVDITIAWGYDSDEAAWDGERDFDFSDFVPAFPDKKVSRMYAGVFYRGSLVDRALLVVADGGRYYVPIPLTTYPNKTGCAAEEFGESEHHYTRWDIGVARIVHSFEHGHSFDKVMSTIDYLLDEDGPGNEIVQAHDI